MSFDPEFPTRLISTLTPELQHEYQLNRYQWKDTHGGFFTTGGLLICYESNILVRKSIYFPKSNVVRLSWSRIDFFPKSNIIGLLRRRREIVFELDKLLSLRKHKFENDYMTLVITTRSSCLSRPLRSRIYTGVTTRGPV